MDEGRRGDGQTEPRRGREAAEEEGEDLAQSGAGQVHRQGQPGGVAHPREQPEDAVDAEAHPGAGHAELAVEQAGERVVTEGADRLRDGSRVQVGHTSLVVRLLEEEITDV